MKRKFIISALVVGLASCHPSRKVSFTVNSLNKTENRYSLTIPKGYTKEKVSYENENAETYIYPDSSEIFFSNNVAQSAFNSEAYDKYGKDLNLKFLSSDTMTIDGINKSNKAWKTIKYNYVVFGYNKVPLEKKAYFDRILKSITVIQRK